MGLFCKSENYLDSFVNMSNVYSWTVFFKFLERYFNSIKTFDRKLQPLFLMNRKIKMDKKEKYVQKLRLKFSNFG